MTTILPKLSIKDRLFLVIFLSSFLVSLLGFIALIYVNTMTEHGEAVRHTQENIKVLSQDLAKIIISSDENISADVVSKLRFFPSVNNVFLYDREGLLVFQYEKSPAASLQPPDYQKIDKSGKGRYDNDWLSIFLPVEYLGKSFGGVFLRLSIKLQDEHLATLYKAILLMLPIMLMLAYLLALWFHRYFSVPIKQLADHVRNIADQHTFFEDVSSEDTNEVGDLSRSISQLLGAIRNTESKLHQSEIRLEAVINTAGSAIITIDEKHRITLFNRQAESVFGYSAREVIGRPLGILLPEKFRESHTKSINDFSKSNIQKCMAQDRPTVPGLRKNGDEFPVEASISQILLGDKKMFTVALTDITQRQQAEQELETYRLHLEDVVEGRTSELREKNSELEAFSYSIAHDLRAPLRSITSFSQILLNDAADKLSAEEQDHLSRVVKAGQHMAELIDGILNLARIGRSQMLFTEVDLSVLVTQAKIRLSQDQSNRSVQWDIQPGLIVRGDSQLLSVVMDNLVNNAWKYTSKEESAKICFGVVDQRGNKRFYIRDNGAGFDMRYAENLFTVFQRFHTDEEFEGTGVGLATVKRIINRHGGAIWAEAAVDKGATFYFTLSE